MAYVTIYCETALPHPNVQVQQITDQAPLNFDNMASFSV